MQILKYGKNVNTFFKSINKKNNLKHEGVPGIVESLKIITREKSMRIAEFAFARAHLMGRKKVTAVHKANIM